MMKNKFGTELEVGDMVNYHMVIGGPSSTHGHKIVRFRNMGGQIVADITDKAACVSIDALSKGK